MHDASRLAEQPFINKKMYAIVEINGQQFKVEEGKKLGAGVLDQDGTAYIAPKHGKDVTAKLKVNGKNW